MYSHVYLQDSDPRALRQEFLCSLCCYWSLSMLLINYLSSSHQSSALQQPHPGFLVQHQTVIAVNLTTQSPAPSPGGRPSTASYTSHQPREVHGIFSDPCPLCPQIALRSYTPFNSSLIRQSTHQWRQSHHCHISSSRFFPTSS